MVNIIKDVVVALLLLPGCQYDSSFFVSSDDDTSSMGGGLGGGGGGSGSVPTVMTEEGLSHSSRLDVLYLIDESISMSGEDAGRIQDYWRQQLAMPLLNSGAEWRVGLRSTDPYEALYKVVDSADAGSNPLLEDLPSYLGGDGILEWGMDSVLVSLQEDIDFHRENADLLVVFISDEDDQSNCTISWYKEEVSLWKESPSTVTETAIVVRDYLDDCSLTWDPGYNYQSVAETDISICSPLEWDAAYDNILAQLPRWQNIWSLNGIPTSEEDIVVYVNGEIWRNWYYDRPQNAVVFTQEPQQNSFILIVYVVS